MLLILCPFAKLHSQGNDNDFQQLFAKSKTLFSKSVESFTKDDLSALQNFISLNPNQFGEENVRLCKNISEQAKKKKAEYDEYVEKTRRMSQTLDELDAESQARLLAEQNVDSLTVENADLKQVIAQLESQIKKYETQTKKLNTINDRLLTEKKAANELLQSSSDLVAQMLNLMGNLKLDDSMYDSLPKNITDSLEMAQCGVTQMMKSNFLITINQLRANQPFMDSAATYYRTNGKHSAAIQGYIDNCNGLVEHLRRSGIGCAMNYASEIETTMNDFLTEIENAENSSGVFIDFLLDNIF